MGGRGREYGGGFMKDPKEQLEINIARLGGWLKATGNSRNGIFPLVAEDVRQLLASLQALEKIGKAWDRVAGFAVCESNGPDGRYRITIDYNTLEKAQDAYRAMHDITKALNG